MPSLPKQVAAAQERARKKEYRLRKKGGSVAGVSAVSPRVPAAQVAAMSKSEQRRYVRQLNAFVARKSSFTALPSGELVETARLRELRNSIGVYNRNSANVIKRTDKAITRISNDLMSRGIITQPFETVTERRARLAWGNTVGGQTIIADNEYGRAAQFRMTEPPSTARALERREDTLKRMTRSDWDDKQRAAQRTAAIKMLYMMDDPAAAALLASLNKDELDTVLLGSPLFNDIVPDYDAAAANGKFGDFGEYVLKNGKMRYVSHANNISVQEFQRRYADDVKEAKRKRRNAQRRGQFTYDKSSAYGLIMLYSGRA